MNARTIIAERLRMPSSTLDGAVEAPHRHYPKHVHRPRRRFELRLREIWIHKHNIRAFAVDFVGGMFAGMWLGWLWLPLRPALTILSKGVFFGGMLHVGSGDRPYVIFLMVGEASWIFFDSMVYFGYKGMRRNRRLIEGLPVPWATGAISTLAFAAFNSATYVGIGVGASIYYKVTQGTFYVAISPASFVKLLVGIGLLAAWGVALSLILSPIIIVVRDARYIMRFAIRFWYFVTPVLYATSSLPDKYRMLAIYNPITAPIEIIKDNTIGTGPPQATSVAVSVFGLAVLLPLALMIAAYIERKAHARI